MEQRCRDSRGQNFDHSEDVMATPIKNKIIIVHLIHRVYFEVLKDPLQSEQKIKSFIRTYISKTGGREGGYAVRTIVKRWVLTHTRTTEIILKVKRVEPSGVRAVP